nr:MAG TPA: hypothetical protein [Caudoviricetes sp.]
MIYQHFKESNDVISHFFTKNFFGVSLYMPTTYIIFLVNILS